MLELVVVGSGGAGRGVCMVSVGLGNGELLRGIADLVGRGEVQVEGILSSRGEIVQRVEKDYNLKVAIDSKGSMKDTREGDCCGWTTATSSTSSSLHAVMMT